MKIKINKIKILFIPIILVLIIFGLYIYSNNKNAKKIAIDANQNSIEKERDEQLNPLSVEAMSEKNYPGSDLTIEEKLSSGSNYSQYITSYKSDGLKIYGLLTVPVGDKPKDGWPIIIFNHGYIPPEQYRTTERYVVYVDVFARNGYIVFKPDYRGNGSSDGQPEGAYYSPAYATDVLNALSSVKKYKDTNPNKIGMWGHSMGGNITLRDLVVDLSDIKAAVIWGGVVGTYDDLMNNWQRRVTYRPSPNELVLRNRYRQNLISKYGTPKDNPEFWNSIDPNSYLKDIIAPLQLHTGANDEEVPSAFSQGLFDRLKKLNKTVEFYSYPNGDHNISEPDFSVAMQRSVEFFDKYLKGGENK